MGGWEAAGRETDIPVKDWPGLLQLQTALPPPLAPTDVPRIQCIVHSRFPPDVGPVGSKHETQVTAAAPGVLRLSAA